LIRDEKSRAQIISIYVDKPYGAHDRGLARPPTRRLIGADDPWATCHDGVVTALVTDG
jgi:hypothetical protein